MAPPFPGNRVTRSEENVNQNVVVYNSTESNRIRHNSRNDVNSTLTRQSSINTPQQLASALHLQEFVHHDKPNVAPKAEMSYIDMNEERSQGFDAGLHAGYLTPLSTHQLIIVKQVPEQKPETTHTRKNPVSSEGIFFSSQFLKQAIVMSMWFVCSFITIVLNKYILSTLDVDAGILGESQILMTTFFGAIMMYLPVCRSLKHTPKQEYFNRYQFFKTISILGWLRFGAIACSVIALKYVAVSFSETIKSSAPLFTALAAYVLLGEYSGVYVNLSLLPIMFGLAITTSTELSFNMTGFVAAISNNVLDCIQNVFSKKLLAGDSFSPLELQFYTSVAAMIVQMPFWFFFMDIHEKLHQIDRYTASMLLFNGIVFYTQSLFAYLLMSLISPVTFSVSNTVKRACLIWFSVLVFGNNVTVLSACGTVLVMAGVFFYQRARHIESETRLRLMQQKQQHSKIGNVLPM